MIEVPLPHDSPSYYLPHHAVLKPESATTKVRVVFNASSPLANVTGLNDVLHAGPILQFDLSTQILMWQYFQLYRWVDPNHTPKDPIPKQDRQKTRC